MSYEFVRHGLLGSDVEDYSSRTEVEQHELQQCLVDLYDEAARRAGLDRTAWAIQPDGDGELALLPPTSSLPDVIDAFPRALSGALTAHNSGARPAMRMRMRLAMHEGLSRPAAGGFAGKGVITVSRMADSAVGRAALRECPAANLVVLLSSTLYEEYVMQGHTEMCGDQLREVEVSTKKFVGTAWMFLPGHDVHALLLETPPSTSDERAAVTMTLNGDLHGSGR